MVDIYNLDKHYKELRQKVKTWEISTPNKILIDEFLSLHVDTKLSPGKKNSTIVALKSLFVGSTKRPVVITKDLKDFTIQDFKIINSKIHGLKLKPETHKFWNYLIKKLYYHLYEDNKEADKQFIINKLQAKPSKLLENQAYSREVTEEETLTIDETLTLLNRATRPIEKALIVTAFEGTKRPNEYLSAKIKDVQRTHDGFVITITPSKGKHRRDDRAKLFIYNLASYFGEFWNSHPYKDRPENPLFYREDYGHEGQSLGSAGAKKIIYKLARKCGMKKRISLYSFRRGGYTWKVKSGMNKATAGRDMGWKPGSSQEQNYLNLTDDDVELERKQLAGKKVVKKSMNEIRDKPCPWCYFVNPPGNSVCEGCGKELDLKKILETERLERKKVAEAQLAEILTNPRLKVMLEEILNKKK